MRFVFFTKTEWTEAPRLRHQLARLLADAGHDVAFFQLPSFPWQASASGVSGHQRIALHRYRQLIHHKLRVHSLLHRLNRAYERRQIGAFSSMLDIRPDDVIVNFNYDYYFLRDLFPGQKIVTIINDDFWSQAIAGYEAPLKWALERTCETSDRVLTVSPSLADQLQSYCNPELFYPWADQAYDAPTKLGQRKQLLFWGYIGDRIDYERVISLADFFAAHALDFELVFVGPQREGWRPLKALARHPVVTLRDAIPLNALPLESVLAAFIPYRGGVKSFDAIVLPNKALQMLARGLPLIITGMPDFLDAPFVFRLHSSNSGVERLLEEVQASFDSLQPLIAEFVEANSARNRLTQFLRIAAP